MLQPALFSQTNRCQNCADANLHGNVRFAIWSPTLSTIDNSKQSSTGSHSRGPSHTSLCVPIGTIGTVGTGLGM